MLTLRTSLFLLFITLSSVHSRPLATGRSKDEAIVFESSAGAKRDANAWGETSEIISEHSKRGTDGEQGLGNPPLLMRPEDTEEEEEGVYYTTKVVYITKVIDETSTETPYPTTTVEYHPPMEKEPTSTLYEVSTTTEPLETISCDPTEIPITESPIQETTSTTVEETTIETTTPVETTDLPEETTTVEPVEPTTTTPSTTTTEPVGFPGEITTRSFILLPQETTTETTTTSSTTTETPTSTSTTITSTSTTTSTDTTSTTTTTPTLPINTPVVVTNPTVPTDLISDDGNLDLDKFGEFIVTQLEGTTPQATESPKSVPVECQGCGNSISRPLEGSGVGRADVLKKGLGGWVVTGLVGYTVMGLVGVW